MLIRPSLFRTNTQILDRQMTLTLLQEYLYFTSVFRHHYDRDVLPQNRIFYWMVSSSVARHSSNTVQATACFDCLGFMH